MRASLGESSLNTSTCGRNLLEISQAKPKIMIYFKKLVIHEFIERKKHYAKIQLINLYHKYKNPARIPFNDINEFFIKKKVNIEVKTVLSSWSYDYSQTKLSNKLRFFKGHEKEYPELIDLLSFGVIPSLFCMFYDSKSFDLYIDFIQSLHYSELLQQLFSRPVFLLPQFLQFLKRVFYQSLHPFYSDESEYDSKKLRQQLLESFESNVSFCPFYNYEFFMNFKKKPSLLKGSFYEQLIEFPPLFQIVDPWLIDSPDYLKIQKILKETIDDEFISKTIQIITNSNLSEKTGLDFEMNGIDAREHMIIDVIDDSVISLANTIITNRRLSINVLDQIFKENIEYNLFKFQFDEDYQFGSSPSNTQGSESFTDDTEFSEQDDDDQLNDLDETAILLYLLLTCDVKNNLKKNVPKSIRELDHKEYREKFIKYVANYHAQSKVIAGDFFIGIISAQRYFSNIKFNQYVGYRRDLARYDFTVSNFLSNNFNKIVEIVHKKLINNNSKIQKAYAGLIENISITLSDNAFELRRAFSENSDPISKIMRIKQIINDMLISILELDLKNLSAKDYVHLHILIFGYTNPPRFVTNMAFLSEFLIDVSDTMRNLKNELNFHFLKAMKTIFKAADFKFDNKYLNYSTNDQENEINEFLKQWQEKIQLIKPVFKLLLNDQIDNEERKIIEESLLQ